MKIAKGILILVCAVLAYVLYNRIEEPIRQNEINKKIDGNIIQKLKDIRTAEIAYKDINKMYCENFDSLIYFLKTQQFSEVIEGEITPIKSYLDSLYPADYPIQDFAKIPHSEELFDLRTTYITKGEVKVHIFQCEEIPTRKDRQPLRVGSLSEITVSGNWE